MTIPYSPGPDELVSSINHQLRTPMTKLLCHADHLESRAAQMPGDIQRSIAAIVLATSQLDDALQWASRVVQGLFSTERDQPAEIEAPLLRVADDAAPEPESTHVALEEWTRYKA